MEHSEQLKDPSVDTDEQFQRGLKAKSLANLFNLRLKTEQPSNVLQERLHFSDRDPPLLVLCISRHSEKPTRYGHQLANALTANFQKFVEGSICIIPVLVEHDEPDAWNTAAQAALETAKRTIPDSRLLMTAAKCQGIERAAFIALGLAAYTAAQRELNQFSEEKIQMDSKADLKEHLDKICKTYEILGQILYRASEDDGTPGKISCRSGGKIVHDSGIMFFSSHRDLAQILCGKSTKEKLSSVKGLMVVAFDDSPGEMTPQEGTKIAVILKGEAKEFREFAEKTRLFLAKAVWVVTNDTTLLQEQWPAGVEAEGQPHTEALEEEQGQDPSRPNMEQSFKQEKKREKNWLPERETDPPKKKTLATKTSPIFSAKQSQIPVTMGMGYTTYVVQGFKRHLDFSCAFDGSLQHKSDKKKVFPGKKRGQHCVPEEDVVVKVFPRQESCEKRCDQEMEAAAEVSRLAKKFCQVCPDVHISVVIPGKAQVDELAIGNSLKSWPLHENQWVLVEDKLSGKFQQFTDESGVCMSEQYRVLEEFAHFVYQETGMVAGNLQGVCQDSGHFRLASPTLHSGSQRLGPRDGGQEAVAGFFSRHCCSKACRHWPTPHSLQQRLDSKGRPPSAPIDISRGRAPPPQCDWPGSDHIDFSRWSTVGPHGSLLSPSMYGAPLLPPYVSPSGDGTSVSPSTPPAYDVIPSAPFESDVTAEDKLYCPEFPPPYNKNNPGLEI